MYGDAHGIAYVLDPRYLGEGMSRSAQEEVEDIIFSTAPSDTASCTDESREVLHRQYVEFRIDALRKKRADPPGFRFKMLLEKKLSVLDYWLVNGDQWPALQKLARSVFTMATSSAASERNFSTFGFVHSKLRNSLSTDSVMKLVYIKTNNRQFQSQQPDPADQESGTDEDATSDSGDDEGEV
jgi:hAT family C-terminal dimerisation region